MRPSPETVETGFPEGVVSSSRAVSTPDVSLAQAFVAARGGTATPESLPSFRSGSRAGWSRRARHGPAWSWTGPRFVGHLARLLPGEDASR